MDIWRKKMAKEPTLAAMIKQLRKKRKNDTDPSGFTSYEFAEATGCGIGKARQRLKTLIAEGLVEAGWIEREDQWGIIAKRKGFRIK